MTKRAVDIDDNLLEAAKAELGTTTIKDTVNAALAEMAARTSRRAEIRRWFSDPYRELRDLAALEKAWRQEPNSWLTRVCSPEPVSSPCAPSSDHCSSLEASPPAQSST